jgi:hypothetical protein
MTDDKVKNLGTKVPDIYPATKSSSDSALQASLCLSGIESLKAPGPDSNYIDWEFVLNQFLQATDVAYFITLIKASARLDTWTRENITVCSVITRTVSSANYRYICPFRGNAFGMWKALTKAHQDSTSGGRMYWIRNLIQSKMLSNDVDTHIKEMSLVVEKLKALITPTNPLTADDLHSSALLISLPPDWLNCVSSLMNKECVSSTKIVSALKAKSLRRKARGDENNPIVVARAEPTTSKQPSLADDPSQLFCKFCNCTGHNLLICNNAERVLKQHKSERQKEWAAKKNAPSSLTSPLQKSRKNLCWRKQDTCWLLK